MGMPQQPQMQPTGDLRQQISRLMLQQQSQFQQKDQLSWQAQISVPERMGLFVQLHSMLQLVRPGQNTGASAKDAVKLETEKFMNSPDKATYLAQITNTLKQFKEVRERNAQSMGHMMPGLANQMNSHLPGQIPQAPMQQNPMQNPLFQQQQQQQGFPAQLQQQMQPSALAQNQMNMHPQFAQQSMSAQQMGPNMTQMGNLNGIPGLDSQKFESLVQVMASKFNDQQKMQLQQQFQALPNGMHKQQILNAGGPILHKAREYVIAQMSKARQAQGQNPGMMQDTMGMQRTASQTPSNMNQLNQGFDPSVFANQQAIALKSQDSGGEVVPASNNPINQRFGNMPMGLNPNAALNLQNMQAGNQIQPGAMRTQPMMNAQQAQISAKQMQQHIQTQQAQQRQRQAVMNANSTNPANQPQMSLLQQPVGQPATSLPRPGSTAPQQMTQPSMNTQGTLQQAVQSLTNTYNSPDWPQRNPIIRNLPPFLQTLPPAAKETMMRLENDKFVQMMQLFQRLLLMQQRSQNQANAQPGISAAQTPQMAPAMPTATMQQQQPPPQTPAMMNNPQLQGPPGSAPTPPNKLTPQIIERLDSMPFNAQMFGGRINVPANFQTWRDFKLYHQNRPDQFPGINPQIFLPLQLKQSQMPQRGPNQAQPANGLAVPPGIQPPAPMTNAAAANNAPQRPQQMPANIPPQLMNVTPQDLQSFREKLRAAGKFNGQQEPSDDQLKNLIISQKITSWRNMQQSRQGVPGAAAIPNNAPNMQLQPPPQRPQPVGQQPQKPGMPTPANVQQPAVNGQPQRASVPPATPQQGVKRPHPENSIDLTQATPQTQAPQAPTANAAATNLPTKAQTDAPAQASAQANGQPSQWVIKISKSIQDLNSKVPAGTYLLKTQEREILQKMISTNAQFLASLDQYLKVVGDKLPVTPQLEEAVKHALFARHLVQGSVEDMKTFTLKDKLTAEPERFKKAVTFISKWVITVAQQIKQQQAQTAAQQPSQQDAAASTQRAPTPLNRENLETHTQQAQAANEKERQQKNQQPPAAPTAGPGQSHPHLPFAASPQGTPQYHGQSSLTPDKLTLPPKKKQRMGPSPAPPTSVPTAAAAKASSDSPDLSRTQLPLPGQHASAPPPALIFKCQHDSCDRAFASEAEAQQHFQGTHISDYLEFSTRVLGDALGFNEDGTRKPGFGKVKQDQDNKTKTLTLPGAKGEGSKHVVATAPIAQANGVEASPGSDSSDAWAGCAFNSFTMQELFGPLDTLSPNPASSPKNTTAEWTGQDIGFDGSQAAILAPEASKQQSADDKTAAAAVNGTRSATTSSTPSPATSKATNDSNDTKRTSVDGDAGSEAKKPVKQAVSTDLFNEPLSLEDDPLMKSFNNTNDYDFDGSNHGYGWGDDMNMGDSWMMDDAPWPADLNDSNWN